jgi:hypothetical protein
MSRNFLQNCHGCIQNRLLLGMEGASQEVVLVESADGIFHSLALTVELNAAGQVNVTRRFREQCARFCRRYLNSDDLIERLVT